MTALVVIEPIIHKTYGKAAMAEALIDHLAAKIETYNGPDRERMILMTCWDWFPGGDTAAVAAHKIEEALDARP